MTRAEMRAAVVERVERGGMSYRMIAADLGITLGSVEWHLKAHRAGSACRVDGLMSPRMRRCVDHYLAGKTYTEIGKIENMSRSAAASLVRRARKFGVDYRDRSMIRDGATPLRVVGAMDRPGLPPPPPRPAMWALAEFDPVIARAARERLILSMAA